MPAAPVATSISKLVPVAGGALAIAHRPKLKDIPKLAAEGVTHVVTLLSEHEGAPQLGAAVRAAGLAWVWVPFAGGDVPDPARDPELLGAFRSLRDLITDGAKVVVHCSAGIHRTGMFTHALLRQLGLAPDAARAMLAELREVTAAGVGEERLAWGDRLVAEST